MTIRDVSYVAIRCLLLFLLFVPLACSGADIGNIKCLSISPDGKFVAVTYAKKESAFVYVISLETGRATRLTTAKTGVEASPNFSPDGKRIAFTYRPKPGVQSQIVIGNADGSDMHPWPPTENSNFRPLFSADNKTIIFARSRYYGNYSPIAQPHSHEWDFYTADLDGTNIRQLTNERFYAASDGSVSPDGKNMAVMTIGVDTPQQIAVYSLNQPGKPVLTLRPHVPNEADHKEPIVDYPNYMPDGKSILFMAATNGKLWHGFDYDVYRLDITTGLVERLTKGNGYATDLKVSANGKTAVFLKWRSDWRQTPVQSTPYLLDLDTHQITAIRITGLD